METLTRQPKGMDSKLESFLRNLSQVKHESSVHPLLRTYDPGDLTQFKRQIKLISIRFMPQYARKAIRRTRLIPNIDVSIEQRRNNPIDKYTMDS